LWGPPLLGKNFLNGKGRKRYVNESLRRGTSGAPYSKGEGNFLEQEEKLFAHLLKKKIFVDKAASSEGSSRRGGKVLAGRLWKGFFKGGGKNSRGRSSPEKF